MMNLDLVSTLWFRIFQLLGRVDWGEFNLH